MSGKLKEDYVYLDASENAFVVPSAYVSLTHVDVHCSYVVALWGEEGTTREMECHVDGPLLPTILAAI